MMDLGFGTSQVLPIVYECLANNAKLILIEQPELHLHPSAQGELANVFAYASKNQNQLLVETHSVAIIERTRHLIRKGEISSKDATIIFVGKDDKKGSYIKQIDFLPDGTFSDPWPEDDFFGEHERTSLSDWW